MTKGVEEAIIAVRDKLRELGWDASDDAAAQVFIAAMDGVLEHVKDPAELGGAISSTGGPFDTGNVSFDARRAVLVDGQEAAKVDPESAGGDEEAFAVMFTGRINQTPDRASVMLLGGIDFMAATITGLHHVAKRAGLHDKLAAACEERWRQMPQNPYLVQRFRQRET